MYGPATLTTVSFPSRRPHGHPSHPATLVAVALGGAAGAVLRWLLELGLPSGQGWPWPTLLANIVGSAALAWLVVHDDRHGHPHWLRPAVGTGLLGGFTTFSTYAVQVALLGEVEPAVALAYLVLTPLLCVGAAALVGTLALRGGRVRDAPPLRRPGHSLEVDLHHAITPVTAALAFAPGSLFARSEPIPGTPFRALAPEDQLLHACLHCFQDGDLALRVREVAEQVASRHSLRP